MNTKTSHYRQSFLLNIPFLLGLALLIINDHYLKAAFGNWFTGKFSDIAGILILPLFLKFIFMRSNRFSILATLLIFVFWKSPFSSPFIDFYNTFSPIAIVRIVDYSDFLAFAVLPFSYYIMENIEKFTLPTELHSNWATSILFLGSSFSFIATSPPYEPVLFDGSDTTNCCIDAPLVQVVGNGTLFIPNIFTPDNDGINDLFQIVADTGIARIDSFEIRNIQTDSLLFFNENIHDITPVNGWDGLVNDTIVPAQYTYTISVISTDSVKSRFVGYVCCVPCAEPTGMVTPLNLVNCGFATQYNEDTNEFDADAPSQEMLDCFE